MLSSKKAKIAVFLSGRGTGFENLYKAQKKGQLDASIELVVSSSQRAGGISIADKYGVSCYIFQLHKYDSHSDAAVDLLSVLQQKEIEYIVLAGYLKLLPKEVVQLYRNRITNIHPALLPKYGGKGMYDCHVHKAVLANGDELSGATVHLVDEIYDHGKILDQLEVPVLKDDNIEALAARVLKAEYELYPKVLQKLILGEYRVNE